MVVNLAGTRILGWLLLIAIFFVTMTVTPYTVTDPMNLPKMCLLIIFSSVSAALIFANFKSIISHERRVIFITIGFFLLLLLVTMVVSPNIIDEQFYGTASRNTGVATYSALCLLLLTSVIVSCPNYLVVFNRVFLTVGLLLIIYGNIQFMGREPFPYINIYENNVFGTFGNPNFQSAFIGMIGVVFFVLALESNIKIQFRFCYILLIILSVLGIYETNSIQGFVNFLIGIFLVLGTYFYLIQKRLLAGLIVFLTAAGISLVLLAFFKVGLLGSFIYGGSLGARVYYWRTALHIVKDHPIFGVGMDGFEDWLRRYRTTQEVTTNLTADSSHSVILDIASGGGIILVCIYLVILGLVLHSIVRVIHRENSFNSQFMVLVGAWFSYQAQSLISINQIGLAIWGWVLSGLIIGYEINTRDRLLLKSEQGLKNKGRVIKKSSGLSLQNFMVIFLGLGVGLAIAGPPFIAASKYYEAFKSTDARIIKSVANLRPYNRISFLQVTNILQRNEFKADALDVAREMVIHFPDTSMGWNLVSSLSAPNSIEQKRAIQELRRLDPNNPAYGQ